MPYGYNGKILHVNLTTKEMYVEEPGENFFRRYLGGRGIVAYYTLRDIPAGADPLGPDNVFVVAASVVTGVPIMGYGRQSCGAKSPLTGFFGESESGGHWGPELKFAGFEAIVVKGVSETPVYLYINNGKYELRDATAMWGKVTGDAHDMFLEDVGDKKAKVLQIGPAGENMVAMAGVCNDLTHYHGRTGMGAVMGSKKLKAIVVRGTNKLQFADMNTIKEISKFFVTHMHENADNHHQHIHGTSDYYWGTHGAGNTPTYNFKTGVFPPLGEYTCDDLHEKFKIKTDGCYACPVRCKQVFGGEDNGIVVDPKYGGPEFEALAAFGSTCGVGEMVAGPKAHELCNKFGLDVVSCGVTIAFAMECYENGLITKEDCDGLELKFGNMHAMLQMIENMAYRRGKMGELLSHGSKYAAEKIGKGSIQYAMQVKGQEFAMAEPRSKFGLGFAYAVSPTGADHLQHEHDGCYDANLVGYSHTADDPGVFMRSLSPIGLLDPAPSLSMNPEKVRIFTYMQYINSLYNCLEMCLFIVRPVRTMEINDVYRAVAAVTGWDTSLWDLIKVGERALNMTRVFNLKHGLKRSDDWIPDRLFEELPEGPLKGSKLDREEMKEAIELYYEMHSWIGEDGVPSKGKLYELSLGWTIDHIKDRY